MNMAAAITEKAHRPWIHVEGDAEDPGTQSLFT